MGRVSHLVTGPTDGARALADTLQSAEQPGEETCPTFPFGSAGPYVRHGKVPGGAGQFGLTGSQPEFLRL